MCGYYDTTGWTTDLFIFFYRYAAWQANDIQELPFKDILGAVVYLGDSLNRTAGALSK